MLLGLRQSRTQAVRWFSNSPRIIQSKLMRKLKLKVDRLPRQGKDPADAFKHGWKLASATILERYPVVTPDPHPFEEEYLKGRFLAEQLRSIPLSAEMFLSERDRLEGKKEPNFHDALAEQYVPASRVTDADRNNDIRSLERALPERLYFLVKASRSSAFRFPQAIADDDNVPLWSFAERAFKAVTDPSKRPAIHYIAPRPCCHLEHVYPVSYQQKHDVYGVKIFFYRAVLLIDQTLDTVRNATDFMWARECELQECVGPEYYKAIKPALYGVGPRNDYSV